MLALEFTLWDVVGCQQLLEALSFEPKEEKDGEIVLQIPRTVDQDMIVKTIEILISIIGELLVEFNMIHTYDFECFTNRAT